MLPKLLFALTICYMLLVAGASAGHGRDPGAVTSPRIANERECDQSAPCDDLGNYRTLGNIMSSCLISILACVYVAVHPNIPGPTQSRLSTSVESLKVVLLTLLAPEWVLAWAVRQFINARRVAAELEEARTQVQRQWENQRSAREVSGEEAPTRPQLESLGLNRRHGVERDRELMERAQISDTEGRDQSRAESNDPAGFQATAEISNSVVCKCEFCHPLYSTMWLIFSKGDEEAHLGRADKRQFVLLKCDMVSLTVMVAWTITHGFYVVMGGFHGYNDGEPLYPLNRTAILVRVRRGELIPPALEEIQDKSNNDALSKGLAVFQTVWFAVQSIARRVAKLPLTHLEVTTWAYNLMTISMYAIWWYKPLSAKTPTRLFAVPAPVDPRTHPTNRVHTTWKKILLYVLGNQDVLVDIERWDRVPTFWSDDHDDLFDENEKFDACLMAVIWALLIATFFGAIHCVAWPYAMPTEIEQTVWRVAAIAITAIPLVVILLYLSSALILICFRELVAQAFLTVATCACAMAYIAARMMLLVLAFTSLRSLPFAAHLDVPWTDYIPHID